MILRVSQRPLQIRSGGSHGFPGSSLVASVYLQMQN